MEETNQNPISGEDVLRPWQSYNTVYTTAKAGMEGVDKEKVQRIVYEMSKGSKYFENEERKETYVKKKIDSMREQLDKLTASDLLQYEKIANNRILELEETRDLSRIWLHVDMDAFYAAVETLSDTSLRGKPMAVGSMSMISTANYEARKFGVRAAMPGFIARKLCPQLVIVPTDFEKYNYYSGLTREVFQKYDPNFIAGSLDEAYLDITNFCNDKGMSSAEVAEELREGVFKSTGLTCSAGVAANRLLAKVCSDINKPNGQFVLPSDRMAIMTFISSLPIRKIGGIGKVTESMLKGVLGITTCEGILQKSSSICGLFSRSSADFFLSVGLGIGRTDTPELSQRKSISTERTFSPTDDGSLLHQKLVDLSENLSSDMKKEDLSGRTLTLKLKTSCFEVRTRAITLANYISSCDDILRHATKLLTAELPISLRLMGLRMSYFDDGKKGAEIDPKQKILSNFLVTQVPSAIEPLDLPLPAANSIAISSAISEEPCYSGYSDMEFRNRVDSANEHENMGAARATILTEATESAESNLSPESKEPISWINDYKCSICGFEIPPDLMEERQEHLDFHLAKRLQDEDWNNSGRSIKPNGRMIGEEHLSHSRRQRKKKQKGPLSDGKHIPIHAFFTKTTQNS